MPNASRSSAPAFTQHLDRLFVWARLVTPSEEDAATLVRATYQHATAPDTTLPPADALPDWLFTQMMRLRDEVSDEASPVAPNGDAPSPLEGVRSELASNLLWDRLRAAFALQSARDQLLLVLSMDASVSRAAIARGFDYSDDELTTALVAARDRLWTEIRHGTTDAEMRLLRNHLPDDALPTALEHLLKDAWATPPPGLRPAAAALADQLAERDGDPQDAAESAPEAHRPAPPDRSSARLWGGIRRLGTAVLLIVTAGLAAYLLSATLRSSPEDASPSAASVIELTARQANDLQPMVTTHVASEAAAVVRNELGWQLAVPTVDAAELRGVSIVELASDARVPAFLFSDSTSGERITVYAFSYAFLDRNADRLALSTTVRQAIEDEARVDVHRIDEAGVLVWRHRNDIYVAVTRGDAEHVRSRIAPSS